MTFFERLHSLVRGFLRALRRTDSFSDVEEVNSATAPRRQRQILLVGTPEKLKWVKFICPCGCGQVIALNLMTSHYPRWTLSRDGVGRVTLSPSVHSTTCGAHFFVRSNSVEWCRDVNR